MSVPHAVAQMSGTTTVISMCWRMRDASAATRVYGAEGRKLTVCTKLPTYTTE